MTRLFPFEFSPDMFTVTTVLEHFLLCILEIILCHLILSVDVRYHSVLGLVTVLFSQELPLECLDTLAELIELDKQALVVVL